MSLPQPLPDNPARWEGWRNYNSDDLYARLCLSFDTNPTPEQIEENCRQLLVWWQKKLPLKNQPSNPIAQMLRAGLDDAPGYLAEARTKLLDPVLRAELDRTLHEHVLQGAIAEFKKILPFAVHANELTPEAEERLLESGRGFGLSVDDMRGVIDVEIARLGAVRVTPAPKAEPMLRAGPAAVGAVPVAGDPFEQFRQILRQSRLALDGDEMSDDQRDAMCNIGESLGLTGGQAEDLIDEYHEEMANRALAPQKPGAAPAAPVRAPAPARAIPAAKPGGAMPHAPAEPKAPAVPKKPLINTSPMARIQERQLYPNFTTRQGIEMMLVTSGQFIMGSDAPEAAPGEQPPVATTIGCFYMARFPITNAQYELFDPAHVTRRPPWANDHHPAVYVSSKDALNFCAWLTARAGHRFRLPTEAEWEYAARGTDNRTFPWGHRLDAGHYANFADARTTFAWSDLRIDDGFAESSPVGSYPRGASPFGIEDLSGNVYEWCLDFFDVYRGTNRINPRGPASGTKRVYRGGSWKSRAASLRASARAFNAPEYVANDVGFRVVCECEA